MNIATAIEILEDLTTTLPQTYPENKRRALLLGIEALEAVNECRASHIFCPGLTMPGETES